MSRIIDYVCAHCHVYCEGIYSKVRLSSFVIHTSEQIMRGFLCESCGNITFIECEGEVPKTAKYNAEEAGKYIGRRHAE